MLTITTTDNQIYISKNGALASGYPKNVLSYRPLEKSLEIYVVSRRETLVCENWEADITINGTEVTPENVNDVLEPLFFLDSTGPSTELPIDVTDVEGLTDILDTKADQIALSEHEEDSKVHFQNYTGDLDDIKSPGVYRYNNNQLLMVYEDTGGYTAQIRLTGTGIEKRTHNTVQWSAWERMFTTLEEFRKHVNTKEIHHPVTVEGVSLEDYINTNKLLKFKDEYVPFSDMKEDGFAICDKYGYAPFYIGADGKTNLILSDGILMDELMKMVENGFAISDPQGNTALYIGEDGTTDLTPSDATIEYIKNRI